MEKVTDKTIVFNASVVSRKGISSLDNTNNFYINGRYMYEHESEAVQVTIEKRSNEGLFAICNGMNNIEHKDNHIVSVIKELDKYSRKVSGFKVDIRSKLEMLGERVQEVHNLVHSMSLDDESYAEGNNAAFSGLVLSEGKAAALNIGDSAAFLFRNGFLRQLTTDYSKPQRLLKMGIIPKDIKTQVNLQVSDIIDTQDGDVFVLCSEGIAEALDDEQLKTLLAVQDEDIDYLTAHLANEATYNGARRDLTVMIIKIRHEAYSRQEAIISDNDMDQSWSDKLLAIYEKKQEALRTFIIAALTCIIIAGIALATPLLLSSRRDKDRSTAIQPATTGNQKNNGASATPTTKPAQSPSVSPSVKPSATVANTAAPTPTPSTTPKPTNSATATPKPSTTPDSSPVGSNEQTYTVKKGDTLLSISKQFYDDTKYYKLIMERNNIKDPNEIIIGQKLIIPEK